MDVACVGHPSLLCSELFGSKKRGVYVIEFHANLLVYYTIYSLLYCNHYSHSYTVAVNIINYDYIYNYSLNIPPIKKKNANVII